MARLPIPGSDKNIWGDILNDFLSTSHEPDGSIKSSAIANKANDNAVVHLSGDESISGNKNFVGTLRANNNDVVVTNDSRLTDERIPTDNSVTSAKIANSSVTLEKTSGIQKQITYDEDANKGSAVTAGNKALFFATDTQQLYISNGSTWLPMNIEGTRRIARSTAASATTTLTGALGPISLASGGLIATGVVTSSSVPILVKCRLLASYSEYSDSFGVPSVELWIDGTQSYTQYLNWSPRKVTVTGSNPVNNVSLGTPQLVWNTPEWHIPSLSATSHTFEIRISQSLTGSTLVVQSNTSLAPATLEIWEVRS